MTKRYLALDTSLSKSGWAVVSVFDRRLSVVDCGVIRSSPKLSDGERLRQIHAGITDVLARYPDVERVIPREEGVVTPKRRIATRQIFKAHGVTEFSLADYEIADVNIQSVKAWARRITQSDGRRNDKAMIAEALRIYFGDPALKYATDDIADAIAVAIVYLTREGVIDA